MWKCGLYLVAILSILMTVFGCGGDSDKIKAGLNEEFVLSVGQSASIAGEDLEIKFKDVTGDSRCPSDVTCVWAGEVTCQVEVKKGGSSSQLELTATGLTNGYTKAVYQDYEISFQVSPYPEASVEIAKDVYRLYLMVTKMVFTMDRGAPKLTGILGDVLAEPGSYKYQDITVVGYYRGWDLLHEANVTPPVSRSDWVIKDATGAIYVSANSEAGVPEGLDPASSTDAILQVIGVVRVTEAGEPYIEATSLERLY